MVMKLKVYGQEIPCQRAEKGTDFVRVYDENGVCIFEATNVKSFEGYALEGGEWIDTAVPPTNEALAAENKLLKQQVSALTEQQSFYEDCIAEMATVVYA